MHRLHSSEHRRTILEGLDVEQVTYCVGRGRVAVTATGTTADLVRHWAKISPTAVAIGAPGRAPLTYAALFDHIVGTVEALNGLGIGRNDRVAAVLDNGPELAVAFLSVSACATFAPLNPAYREEEYEFYLSDLDAAALVVEAGTESAARGVARSRGIPIIELTPDRDGPAGRFILGGDSAQPRAPTGFARPEDIALVLHTSGTTSRPKIVPLSAGNLSVSAANVSAALALSAHDRCLNVMPLFHIHGLVAATLASLTAGASVVCTPGFFVTDFEKWLNESSATWYTAVPTMHQAVLARRSKRESTSDGPSTHDSTLRFIRSSSAALPLAVIGALEAEFGVPVIEAYGMTEAAHQMTSNPLPPGERKPGSVGPAAGPSVAVMDDAGELLPPGVTGEVVIRGPNVTAGYDNNPEANAAAFTAGWFRTGDQGFLDEDGYLFLTGRLKEIINRGGEKIAPREVDDVLLGHPGVAQAVTFAVPHATLGEEVAAAVVRRDEVTVTAADLRSFTAAHLAEFKVPRRIVFVTEIPKGSTGKLQRIGLAEKLGITTARVSPGDAAGEEYVEPRNDTERIMADIWAEVLDVGRVGVHDNFFELGGDSMLATRIAARVQDRLGVELPLIALFEYPTPAGVSIVVDGGEPPPGTSADDRPARDA